MVQVNPKAMEEAEPITEILNTHLPSNDKLHCERRLNRHKAQKTGQKAVACEGRVLLENQMKARKKPNARQRPNEVSQRLNPR